MGIVSGFRDFRRGLSVIFGKPPKGEGDRRLAKVSLVVEAQINKYTKHDIRRGVIGDIERVLRGEAKKGGREAVDRKVATCLATPEWVRMIHRLDLGETEIQLLAMEVIRDGKK